jgi:hypothetical protein
MYALGMAVVFPASAASPSGPRKTTLDRTEDYIVLTGENAPSLIGSETGDLHLFAYGPSGFRAVPFQIDKRDSEGRYVFPDETMHDPLRDGDRLDSNDEMVFMVRDAGDRRPDDGWLGNADRGVEIELFDPLDQGRAWVYIFKRPGADQPEVPDYVSYREEGDTEIILSDNYQQGVWMNVPGMHMLRLRRSDGSWSPDILEGQRQWVIASLLRGAVPIYIPEQEATKRVIGVIDGPVRVIKDQLSFLKVKIIGVEVINETFVINYGNGHISPVEANIPITISKLFLDVDIYYSLCLNEAVRGSTYFNPANPEGILLDGKNDQEIDAVSDNEYMVVSGPEGSIVVVMDLGDDLKKQGMVRTTLVREEPTKDRPIINDNEILAGFWYQNSKRISRGTYYYSYYHYFPYPYSDQKPQEIVNMIEHPVEINVRPLSPP